MTWWPRSRPAGAARAVLRTMLLFPLVRVLCSPKRVLGRERLSGGAVVYVANHASHADTALVLRALPRRARSRCAPAAAADYFFRNRFAGAATSLVIGAFPFPRRGREGLRRARALLDRGWSVLLYPEGTRTLDGTIGSFRPGAAILAAETGAAIVPVGLSGTRDVLRKGRTLPRRASVAVVFGEPVRLAAGADPAAATARIEAAVRRLAAEAETARPPRTTWYAKARAFASSPAGLVLAFAWAFAEAIAWPVVPDLAVATLALAAPRRILPIAGAAIAGSLAGGLVAYGLGAAAAGAPILDHVPLVTERMQASAAERLGESGAAGILSQPWSGIPFKVFALQAHDAGTGLGGFAWYTLLARGSRILQIGCAFAAAGLLLRGLVARFYPLLVAAYTVVFSYGLAKVVGAWS